MGKLDYIPQTPCICINLRRIAQKVTDCYDKALKPAGVSANQYSLLVNIGRMEGCGTGKLAERVRLEKSTLVRTLQPLFRQGLITDNSSAGNRRRSLCLTQAGEQVLKKAFPLWKRAQDEIAGKLGIGHAELMSVISSMDSD